MWNVFFCFALWDVWYPITLTLKYCQNQAVFGSFLFYFKQMLEGIIHLKGNGFMLNSILFLIQDICYGILFFFCWSGMCCLFVGHKPSAILLLRPLSWLKRKEGNSSKDEAPSASLAFKSLDISPKSSSWTGFEEPTHKSEIFVLNKLSSWISFEEPWHKVRNLLLEQAL